MTRKAKAVPPVVRNAVLQEGVLALSRPDCRPDSRTLAERVAAVADGLSYEKGLQEGWRRAEAAISRHMEEARAALQLEAEQARRNGFDTGREEGLREMREQAAQEQRKFQQVQQQWQAEAARTLREQVARVDALAGEVRSRFADLLALAEDDAIALVYEAVCTLAGAAAAEPDITARLVKTVLAQRSASGPVRIHVNPMDVEWLASMAGIDAAWVADESVAAGCVIRSEDGALDARLVTQLEAFRDLLLRVRGARPAGGST
jgi:flagellar assembly protein FliH